MSPITVVYSILFTLAIMTTAHNWFSYQKLRNRVMAKPTFFSDPSPDLKAVTRLIQALHLIPIMNRTLVCLAYCKASLAMRSRSAKNKQAWGCVTDNLIGVMVYMNLQVEQELFDQATKAKIISLDLH